MDRRSQGRKSCKRSFNSKRSMPGNILQCISERQIALSDEFRDELNGVIYRLAVLQPSFQFHRVWTKISNQPVCIGLDRRIYFNSHTECYFNDGVNGQPYCMYRLPIQKSKIWAAILYHCHIRCKPLTLEEQTVCLIALTSDGYLKVLDADTGDVICSVYLSTEIVFRYLSWADYLSTIQLKSVKALRQNPPRQDAVDRANDTNRGRVLSLLVFKIHPLRLLSYFHVEKHIFGDNVRDASVTEDLLIIMSSSSCYYYDLHWIIENCSTVDVSLDKPIKLRNSGWFQPGVYPNSVPVTIKIDKLPPLLFTTVCSPELGVSFGGYPTVYIHNAHPNNINEFHVTELQTNRLVAVLKTDLMAFHQDVAEFHFDNYKRVIHISGCTVSCYQLCRSQSNSNLKTRLLYHLDFKQIFEQDADMPLVSRRGRTIKRVKSGPNCFNDFVSAVQDLDYENELELLYAVITVPEGAEGTKAFLCFINEKDGSIDKVVPIPTWDSTAGNSIYYELDCIIHLVQGNARNVCHFYRLTRQFQ